ncbi:hypothetical protein BDY21DRAFT_360907 [Lineolata rhizophorae]|uniref:Uncharacterized protein n=1 Tax=Lineolata rhizophorae TaxID=578093 RepID=A0A6A6PAG1_9PEZI|nr:hypothetical protein BDY21DRAFT_360907 [Lineolata rhizophorae]
MDAVRCSVNICGPSVFAAAPRPPTYGGQGLALATQGLVATSHTVIPFPEVITARVPCEISEEERSGSWQSSLVPRLPASIRNSRGGKSTTSELSTPWARQGPVRTLSGGVRWVGWERMRVVEVEAEASPASGPRTDAIVTAHLARPFHPRTARVNGTLRCPMAGGRRWERGAQPTPVSLGGPRPAHPARTPRTAEWWAGPSSCFLSLGKACTAAWRGGGRLGRAVHRGRLG